MLPAGREFITSMQSPPKIWFSGSGDAPVGLVVFISASVPTAFAPFVEARMSHWRFAVKFFFESRGY
jgi:hypothetical protein